MTGLPKTELAGRRRRTWPVRFTGFELRCRFSSPPLVGHLRNRYFSGVSATEARWRAFATVDAPLLIPGTELSLAGVDLMHKTRLQLTNFSRILYLYKAF